MAKVMTRTMLSSIYVNIVNLRVNNPYGRIAPPLEGQQRLRDHYCVQITHLDTFAPEATSKAKTRPPPR